MWLGLFDSDVTTVWKVLVSPNFGAALRESRSGKVMDPEFLVGVVRKELTDLQLEGIFRLLTKTSAVTLSFLPPEISRFS